MAEIRVNGLTVQDENEQIELAWQKRQFIDDMVQRSVSAPTLGPTSPYPHFGEKQHNISDPVDSE